MLSFMKGIFSTPKPHTSQTSTYHDQGVVANDIHRLYPGSDHPQMTSQGANLAKTLHSQYTANRQTDRQIRSNTTRSQYVGEKLKRAEKEISILNKEINNLSTQSSGNSNEIERLKAAWPIDGANARSYRRRIESLEKKNSKIEKKITKLKIKKSDKSTEIEKFKSEILSLDAQNKKLNPNLDFINSKINSQKKMQKSTDAINSESVLVEHDSESKLVEHDSESKLVEHDSESKLVEHILMSKLTDNDVAEHNKAEYMDLIDQLEGDDDFEANTR